jgi:hypothetical protein
MREDVLEYTATFDTCIALEDSVARGWKLRTRDQKVIGTFAKQVAALTIP